jgi:diguanylate cyclase (GGDEF)-like protein/PAS domain S-box-containing protein
MTKPRILIVEDEAIIALDIGQQLARLGYETVGHASEGEEAVRMAGESRPDLVLMDIQLGGDMDGIAAAKLIRERHRLPIVFLTAFAADDILARAKLIEPFGYILKPFSERELRTVLEMALYKHQADQSLIEAADHTRMILDNMLDGVITIDPEGRIASLNQAACRLFGYEREEVLGHNVTMLIPEPHKRHHDGYLRIYRDTGEARMIGMPREVEGLHRDGSLIPLSLAVSKMEHLGQTSFIGVVRDTTQRRNDMEKIRQLAFYDHLTGLPNRRLLMDRLRHAMASSDRTGHQCALMFLDLDHFKLLNDTMGHEMGDLLLQQVASRLGTCVSDRDAVARLGGDEFVLLLETLGTSVREAAALAEAIANQVLSTLGKPYTLRDITYNMTPSIGIVMFGGGQIALNELLKRADVAMYQAKAAGRNGACFYDPAIQAAATERAQLVVEMRRGLECGEFMLYYQPQVDRTGRVIGAEALVRWNHPANGTMLPEEFISLAEETSMILPLGQWVLETACAQLVVLARHPETADWSIAINVSALQFAQANFVAQVDKALKSTGANPTRLKLELTESMLAVNMDDIIAKMKAINSWGGVFSLDDFGTGYSSLSYLKSLPLAQLKIDQSFVRDLLTDPSDAVIARTIVALGHSLGLAVIAEGVETREQRDLLIDMDCDAFQGNYFGRPGPVSLLTGHE